MTVDSLRIIDSHTAGEPTRTVVSDLAPLQGLSATQQRDVLQTEMDWIRRSLILEPRGSDVIVGAVLGQSNNPECIASVVFFNNVDYLGMCGHGLIGITETLAFLGQIETGQHKIDTPVGIVTTELLPDGRVRFDNIPSYRYRKAVTISVPNYGTVTGDVAWGGNWFFLSEDVPEPLTWKNRLTLVDYAANVRQAAEQAGITGEDGALIDHYEFFRPCSSDDADADNFVLCPGGAFDRSPCGTGTSAKLACLAADNKLAAGESWKQRSLTGGVFEGTYREADQHKIIPSITGKAYINGKWDVVFDPNDPLRFGLPNE